MTAWKQQLESGLAALECDPPAQAITAFITLVEELQRWNRAYNLTAIDRPEEIVTHHVLDSLAILPWLPEQEGSVLDIGCGAGFPAIPLAIVRPDLDVTALDAVAKKLRFITHMQRRLGLGNLAVVHARVEDHRPENPPEVITARALASLQQLTDWSRRWLASGSTLLAMKGKLPAAEMAAVNDTGLSLEIRSLSVPGLPAERHLVIITDPEANHQSSPAA